MKRVMIARDGYAKILDFGLAKLFGDDLTPPSGFSVVELRDYLDD